MVSKQQEKELKKTGSFEKEETQKRRREMPYDEGGEVAVKTREEEAENEEVDIRNPDHFENRELEARQTHASKSEEQMDLTEKYEKWDQNRQALGIDYLEKYVVEQDVKTKKWHVCECSHLGTENKKWMVEFHSKSDADAFKKDLQDGRTETPIDAPEKYGTPKKHSNGTTMIFTKA